MRTRWWSGAFTGGKCGLTIRTRDGKVRFSPRWESGDGEQRLRPLRPRVRRSSRVRGVPPSVQRVPDRKIVQVGAHVVGVEARQGHAVLSQQAIDRGQAPLVLSAAGLDVEKLA